MTDYTLSFPSRPSLEHLKKQAKRLLSEIQTDETQAIAMANHHERNPSLDQFGLQDAQRILARAYGFASWARLKEGLLIRTIKNGDVKNLLDAIQQSSDPQKLLAARIEDENPTGHAFGTNATLLQFASFRKWKGDDVAKLLVENGAELDLHSACGMGDLQAIESIVKNDPQQLNHEVDTFFPVQYAISRRQSDAIRLLMKLGEDPNRAVQKLGWYQWENEAIKLGSPEWKIIHMAAIWGHKGLGVTEALHEAGADLHVDCPLDGYRPIHLAASQNLVDSIRFYVTNGVDVDSRTSSRNDIQIPGETMPVPHGGYDWTALMVTAGEGFIETAQCLLDLKADASTVNSMGRTPLHIAAGGFWSDRENIYAQVVKALLQHGADKNIRDADGKFPIDFAKMKNYSSIVSLLEA